MSRDPSLSAELADFKRRQAEVNRQERESLAPTIIQAPLVDTTTSAEPSPNGAPAKCWYCSGAGVLDALIGSKKNDCHVCEATGYDLSDPLAVIKYLLAGGRKLRLQYQGLKRETRELRELIGEDEIKRRQEEAWVKKHHSRFD